MKMQVNRTLSDELKKKYKVYGWGNCFHNSIKYVFKLKGAKYVEGYYLLNNPPGLLTQHSWIIYKNEIIDLTVLNYDCVTEYYPVFIYPQKKVVEMKDKIKARQKIPLYNSDDKLKMKFYDAEYKITGEIYPERKSKKKYRKLTKKEIDKKPAAKKEELEPVKA